MWIGNTGGNIRSSFPQREKSTRHPLIDEIDALGASRDSGMSPAPGIASTTTYYSVDAKH